MRNSLSALMWCGLLSTTACVSQADFNRLQTENDRLDSQLAAQNQELVRVQTELNYAKAIADVHGETEETYQEWIGELEQKIESQHGLKLLVNETTGESQIQIANTLLFSSGDIEISSEGIDSLGVLAEQLISAPGTLRIDGHTDNQPIRSAKTQQHSKNNWQLSVNRSLAVLRVLLDKGVSPEKLSVAGYGMHQPIIDNGPRGNSENRRVEIVFIPNITEETSASQESTTVESVSTDVEIQESELQSETTDSEKATSSNNDETPEVLENSESEELEETEDKATQGE